MTLRLTILLSLLLPVAVHGWQNSPAEWIKKTAIPLSTPEAGAGFADMQPLKALVGDARIVSLGEPTHGSREVFQLKHRMLEFLATEMGFTVFSIEASMPEAYKLNEYVQTGEGDPARLVRQLGFWTWDTEEVLAMVRWMREFNVRGKARLQFTGFDMQNPVMAIANVSAFVDANDPAYAATLSEAKTKVALADVAKPVQALGVASFQFPVAEAVGKRLRLSGFIKTSGVAPDRAGLWMRVNGPSGVLAFDNMQNRGATGTTPWTRYSLELPVDAAATSITLGVLLPTAGEAWFDDLTVELDDKPYPLEKLIDPGFESPALRGIGAGGEGFTSALDSAVAHEGSQSLRFSRDASRPAPAVPQTAYSPERWKAVVEHLQAQASTYRTRGVPTPAIEWALQNARIVLQGLPQTMAQRPRDQSMADNVKWIADQNPGARMVLWAHNGHVAAAGFGEKTMGRYLRTMYGPQMLVMGILFGEGGFQAIAQTGRTLRTFTVPPAPQDTLDGAFVETGLPLLALDLRKSPEWFGESKGSRFIGAIYPENQPFAMMAPIVARSLFDAVLFVRTTTPARPLPK